VYPKAEGFGAVSLSLPTDDLSPAPTQEVCQDLLRTPLARIAPANAAYLSSGPRKFRVKQCGDRITKSVKQK
jgi:hypothetical protein